jgi:hypothetical protein
MKRETGIHDDEEQLLITIAKIVELGSHRLMNGFEYEFAHART